MRALATLTTPQVPVRPLLVLPVGATEQHGPHLPLGSDALVAEAAAAALASRLDAVLVPVLAIGASGEHQGFAGTLSIGAEALRLVVVELGRSAALWAGGVVVVNAHGGNVDALRAAVGQLRDEGHRALLVLLAVPGGDAHAGRTETSLLLHLHPGLVGDERPVGNREPLAGLLPALRREGVAALSPSGVLGDARGASAEEGERVLAAMVDAAETRVRSWLRGCGRAKQTGAPSRWTEGPA